MPLLFSFFIMIMVACDSSQAQLHQSGNYNVKDNRGTVTQEIRVQHRCSHKKL